MESWMRSRSLMMGKESTEESRKEMRNRPGAPSPLAKAIIFCFHPLRVNATRNSRLQPFLSRKTATLLRRACKKTHPSAIRTVSLADSSIVLEQRQDHRARLLRKRGAVEVVHEDLHQRGAMKIGKPGYFSDDPDVPKSFDGLAILAVLIANQDHSVHGQFSCMQRSQRKQRVINRPRTAARR